MDDRAPSDEKSGVAHEDIDLVCILALSVNSVPHCLFLAYDDGTNADS